MMNVKYLILVYFISISHVGYTQKIDEHAYHNHQVYELDWKKKELVLLGTGIGLTVLGQVMHYNSDGPSLTEINNLDSENLNFLDKTAIDNNSQNARNLSDYVLYGAVTLPFLSYFSSNCRQEATTIGVMAAEAFLINLGITIVSKETTTRYRPYNYNPDTPLGTKLEAESNRSFLSGHTSATATLAFLTARVLTEAHPESNKKYIIWTTAATIPAIIGYLRVQSGRHFPTDAIAGYAIGATIGYLIPEIHLKDDIDLELQGIGGLSLKVNF